jgi:hypothetical protein
MRCLPRYRFIPSCNLSIGSGAVPSTARARATAASSQYCFSAYLLCICSGERERIPCARLRPSNDSKSLAKGSLDFETDRHKRRILRREQGHLTRYMNACSDATAPKLRSREIEVKRNHVDEGPLRFDPCCLFFTRRSLGTRNLLFPIITFSGGSRSALMMVRCFPCADQ